MHDKIWLDDLLEQLHLLTYLKSSNILELYLIKDIMKSEANVSESTVANFVLKAY